MDLKFAFKCARGWASNPCIYIIRNAEIHFLMQHNRAKKANDFIFPNSIKHFYHPRMRVGNIFGHVCLCVCLSVCLSVCVSVCLCVCLSVQAITFEPLDIETSFLVYRYIFTISRSILSIKVIGSRSR